MNFLLRNSVKKSQSFSSGLYASLSFSESIWLSWTHTGIRRCDSWRHEIAETVWLGRQFDWGHRPWTTFSFSMEVDGDFWNVTPPIE